VFVKPWSDFYDLVAPHLPGCPAVAMDNALRQSAIAFCEQSLAWRFDHPPIAVESGVAAYPFAPPVGSVVHAILQATLDGREITCGAGGCDMAERNSGGSLSAMPSYPSYIFGGTGFLTLVPEPAANGSLALTAALKPSPTSTGVGEREFDEYRETIVHGALSRLMSSPKKPYTHLQLASYHQEQFGIKTGAAAMREGRGCTRTPLRTRIMGRA
jgi:hypothetical protein